MRRFLVCETIFFVYRIKSPAGLTLRPLSSLLNHDHPPKDKVKQEKRIDGQECSIFG